MNWKNHTECDKTGGAMARKSVRRTISLPPHVDARAAARVQQLDTDFSNYIQQLIRQDVGMPYIIEDPREADPARPFTYQQKVAEDPLKKGHTHQSTEHDHPLPEHDHDRPA